MKSERHRERQRKHRNAAGSHECSTCAERFKTEGALNAHRSRVHDEHPETRSHRAPKPDPALEAARARERERNSAAMAAMCQRLDARPMSERVRVRAGVTALMGKGW